jgi:hypothetical protein
MKYPLLLLACLSLTGFTTQPLDERAAQSSLPQSPDKLWDNLAEADINSNLETGVISAKMPDSIKAMAGKPLKISGFMMPLEAEEKFTHFLLSRRTPTCAYCPPGEPDELIEVFSTKATEWDEGLVTYEGTLELINNQDMGLFYRLNQAEKK